MSWGEYIHDQKKTNEQIRKFVEDALKRSNRSYYVSIVVAVAAIITAVANMITVLVK